MNTTTRPTRMAPSPGVAQQQLPQTFDGQSNLSNQLPRQTVMAPSAPAAKAYPPKIAKAILHVTRNINPVAKAGFNDFHKYAYRKFEDVFEELVPLINDAGLIIQQSELTHGAVLEGMIAITYQFTIINEDGDVWPDRPELTAICKVKDHKGMLDDKAASKCNTQAQKYFYTSFFKIRSVDTKEADHDSGERPARRTAPNPQGEFKPHFIPITEGETAEQWAERFKGMLKHAKTPEDIDEWYAANERVFTKLAAAEGYKPVYQGLIDAMDARAVELAPKQQRQEIISHPDNGESEDRDRAIMAREGFPGDSPMKSSAIDAGDIPLALRRTAPPPTISAKDQQFLDDLEAEYGSCNNIDELSSVQDSVMMPMRDHVPADIWKHALAITTKHMQRVEGHG